MGQIARAVDKAREAIEEGAAHFGEPLRWSQGVVND